MEHAENVSYKEIHAYMLRKTQEYYQNPPAVLVEAVMEKHRAQGETISLLQARKEVSLIEIQRFIKKEMTEKWPEFMGSIQSNSLRE